MDTVVFSGWNKGLKKVHFTFLLRQYAELSLANAKRIVDSILEGNNEFVQCKTKDKASKLAAEASKIGATN